MNSFALKPWIVFYLLPFLGGTLYPMGFPMKTFPHFMGFSFLGMFLFLQALPIRMPAVAQKNLTSQSKFSTNIISTLLFSLGYCLVGYYWIPYTLTEFGDIPFPFSQLLGALFSLIIVPQLILFVVIINLWRKFEFKQSSLAGGLATRNIIYSLVLVLFESFTPQQFPAHLGHAWLQLSPFLGLSPIFGVLVYSFFGYWLILSFVSLWHIRKMDKLGVGFFSLFLGINLIFPLAPTPEIPTDPSQKVHLRLVQANVGNFMKLQSETGDSISMGKIFERYVRLSTQKTEENSKKVDLIIWPETAYPQLLNTAMMRVTPAFVPTVVRKTVREANTFLLFGGYDKSGKDNTHFYETEYNSSFFINPDGTLNDVYHKRLLIPFGESLPFGPLNPILAKISQNISFFAKGQKFPVFKLDRGQSFISIICYEALFSFFIRDFLNSAVKQPQFIVNLTNDSWYGNTSEPYQHKHLAHWRALEFQMPMVRMTNTGITSVLYPNGEESKRLPLFKQGVLDIEVPLSNLGPTYFQRYGILPFLLLVVILFLFSWTSERYLNKNQSN